MVAAEITEPRVPVHRKARIFEPRFGQCIHEIPAEIIKTQHTILIEGIAVDLGR